LINLGWDEHADDRASVRRLWQGQDGPDDFDLAFVK
jgi:hypothetical protein